MSLVRLLILAEERLLGLGLASLLNCRYDVRSTESPDDAAALFEGHPVDIAVWLGECLDTVAVAQLATLKDDHPGARLCVLARTADSDALRLLLALEHVGIALV